MSKSEGRKYKPTSIRKLLTEMKDLADLMLDLAYSAVLFESEDIAEEVSRLEKRMDNMLIDIRTAASLASRDTDDAKQMSGILQVANASENIADAAGEIVNIVSQEMGLHECVMNALKTSDEKIMRTQVMKNSSLVGKSIKQLKIASKTGMYILAIRRGTKWIYKPKKSVILSKDDVVIARGCDDGVDLLKNSATGEIQL